MVYPFLTGSTLLRTQRTVLPRIHLRYKSISAAIERGRNDGPDRPFRSRPRNDGDDNGQLKTRREARFEKFGPPRDEPPPRDERRSSRFGRVPRDNDAPSRSNDGEERKPTSWMGRGSRRVGKEEGGNRAWKEKPKSAWALAGHNTLARDGLPVNKFMREELTGPEERAPRQERVGRDIVEITNEARMTLTKSFDRPRTSFGGDGGGESREFNREDRGGERRSFNRDDRGGERRTFNREDRGGDRRPFNRDDTGGERRSFNRDDRGGERRTFNRDDRGGERRTFNREDGGGERRPFNRDDRGGERRVFNRDDRGERREFNPERSERFPRRDGDAPPSTFRSRDAPEDRPRESRFTQRPDSKGARRERNGRDDTDAPSTTVSTPFVRGPESLPYTTAASEFVYGHSSVLAAIKANRRKFYNLYVHSRGASRDGLMSKIRAHKLFSITQEVGDEYMRALDKASSGRPHNGVILESSPLPVPPITELKTSSVEDESFSIGLDTQTKEDEDVNGKQELYSYRSGGWRHPLILYVDGVVDEGNLGAIARSAYVLGADAIITPTHHTAVWSHIAVKASAGAAEALPVFKIGQPTDFLSKSAQAGWKIYASDAIPPAPASFTTSSTDEVDGGAETAVSKVVYTINKSSKRLSVDHSPVAEHPTILMMGAEGTGLKTSLLNLAHYKVGIPHGREVNEVGVDSLNVSVAASILCYEMLQKPTSAPKKDTEDVLF